MDDDAETPVAEDEATVAAEPSELGGIGRGQKILRIAMLAAVAVFTLGAAVILGLNMARDEESFELPTFTPTLTRTATVTSSPTATPTATETPLPTATYTPIPPIEYIVQPGDTLGAIALEHDITVAELIAYNELDSEFIGEGQLLLLPPPTPTPGPTPTPEPGRPTETPSAFILHTVQSGDTLSTIAQAYGVSVDVIRAANDIDEGSETIRPDQVLTIPRPTPTPEPETIPNVTPTPTPGLTRYPAPTMLFPPDGTVFTGQDQTIALQWASVGILDSREFYQIELVVPGEDGRTTHQDTLRSTVWRVPAELFPPETVEDRRLAWRVFVVRQVTDSIDSDFMIVSQTTPRRSFTWLPD